MKLETRYFADVKGKGLYKVNWDTTRDGFAGGVTFDHLAKSWGHLNPVAYFSGFDAEPMHALSADAAQHLFVGYGGAAADF
jgi:hypothetical protein